MPIPKTGALPLGYAPTSGAPAESRSYFDSTPETDEARRTPLHNRRAQPSYTERRANQFRVRLPVWRVAAHLRCQKSRKPLTRSRPELRPAHPTAPRPVSLWQSPARGQKQLPQSHFRATLTRLYQDALSVANLKE